MRDSIAQEPERRRQDGDLYSRGSALLLARHFEAFAGLREHQREDHSPFWRYADAFHAVASNAPAAVRKSRLEKALAANPHVSAFLLIEDPRRLEPAARAERGSPEEAHALACSIGARLWRANSRALATLARTAAGSRRPAGGPARADD